MALYKFRIIIIIIINLKRLIFWTFLKLLQSASKRVYSQNSDKSCVQTVFALVFADQCV